MRMHFSRVKDCVLVAVQRRDAGRASLGTHQNDHRKNPVLLLKNRTGSLNGMDSFRKVFIFILIP